MMSSSRRLNLLMGPRRSGEDTMTTSAYARGAAWDDPRVCDLGTVVARPAARTAGEPRDVLRQCRALDRSRPRLPRLHRLP